MVGTLKRSGRMGSEQMHSIWVSESWETMASSTKSPLRFYALFLSFQLIVRRSTVA